MTEPSTAAPAARPPKSASQCEQRTSAPLNRARDVFVLPGGRPGSLGDVAMVEGLKQLLSDPQREHLRYFGYQDESEWARVMQGRTGGRLPSSLLDWIRFYAFRAREMGTLYINGADVLDGGYSIEGSLRRLTLARRAARLGRPVTITGFSMRENTPEPIVAAFRALPHEVRLCARDPKTHARLSQRLDRPVQQVADLAFLMEPSVDTDHERLLLSQLAAARASGRRLIGVCLSLHSARLLGSDDRQRANHVVECMRLSWKNISTAHPDCVPVILYHDIRGRYPDATLGAMFVEASSVAKTAIYMPPGCSPRAVKAFCAELDVLITGRMHCGIAALGRGVPAVMFDYQDKVTGLLEMFGLTSSVQIAREPGNCASDVHGHVNGYLEDAERVRQAITRRLPAVRGMAAVNAHPAGF